MVRLLPLLPLLLACAHAAPRPAFDWDNCAKVCAPLQPLACVNRELVLGCGCNLPVQVAEAGR